MSLDILLHHFLILVILKKINRSKATCLDIQYIIVNWNESLNSLVEKNEWYCQ